MADGAKKLCSGDYVLEDGVRVGPYKMVWRPGEGRRKPLDAGSTGPVVIGNLGGGLCPAPDVFRLTCWWWWCGTPFLQEKSVLLSRRPATYLVYGRLLTLSIRWPVSLLCHAKKTWLSRLGDHQGLNWTPVFFRRFLVLVLGFGFKHGPFVS